MALRIIVPTRKIINDDTIIDQLNDVIPRGLLFFDESIVGYVICTKKCQKISLDLTIDSNENPINENNINILLDKDAIVYENEGTTVWRFEISVNYPRKRLNNPHLFLTATLIDEELKIEQQETEYVLPNFEPCMKKKLLSELGDFIEEPETESIIEEEVKESQKIQTTINIPVTVSLVIKLKSTKPAGRNNMLLATLNTECSDELLSMLNHQNYYFKILDINLNFRSGSVESLNDYIPAKVKYSDSINLTYKLINHDNENQTNLSKPIPIKLSLIVQDENENNISNIIQTEWTPYLDFSLIAPPINNALKTTSNYSQLQSTNIRQKAMMNSLYKLKSPTASNQSIKKIIKPSMSSSVTVNLTTNNNSSLSGLKLTFIGKLDIKLGEVTSWKIQAINNSMNRLNLSLLVQNPINFNPVYSSNYNNNNGSSSNLLPNQTNDLIIYNKNQLYSLYNTLKADNNDEGVLILNNDIRIGPLDPHMVFETEIQLIGVNKGIFNLDGIKIFDMHSRDGLDFGKLIEVFVV
ncbi:unnamed protein product [Candida verbasci]|uniref:Trafficking protein particle complex II-specific subunit 65 IgD3 domain-containing protein n=1 Tax=Candida verbasci TaxID=1227364 RepID=A0A9W4XL86_9ASCO|nr:unnamed protein product [Candida verbasci]